MSIMTSSFNTSRGGRHQAMLKLLTFSFGAVPLLDGFYLRAPQGFLGSGENGFLFSGSLGALVIILG